MFVIKVTRDGALPSLAIEDSIDQCVDLAKSFVDDEILKEWDKIGVVLKTKRKWSDGKTTIAITGK